jgi:hypothetical protein
MSILTFLPLDLTGQALSNRVANEEHHLITLVNKPHRVVVCTHGGFYTDNLAIRDATGRTLTRGTDYTTTYHYEQLSTLTGREVMGLIVITNAAVKSPVNVDYRAVGGGFSVSVKELQTLLDNLELTEMRFTWEDIVGLPEAYTPAPHEHEYWQLYGMESTVTQLDRVANSWRKGRTAVLANNKEYGERYVRGAEAEVTRYETRVDTHLNDKLIPHRVTKAQIGLPNMNDWPASTASQVINSGNTNTYMPVGGTYRQLSLSAIPQLNTHIANKSNPHGTTAAMIDVPLKTAVDAVFAQRLHRTQIAADTALLGSQNASYLISVSRTNLDVSCVAPTVKFAPTHLGDLTAWQAGDSLAHHILVGNKTYRHLSRDIFPTYEKSASDTVWLGGYSDVSAAVNYLNLTYPNAAYGTSAISFRSTHLAHGGYMTTFNAYWKENNGWRNSY